MLNEIRTNTNPFANAILAQSGMAFLCLLAAQGYSDFVPYRM
jgi:hypothetical protein